jgi:DNA polymerase III gamma/tau subunit
MRHALNNLQSTVAGFDGLVNAENVYRLVDVPSPDRLRTALKAVALQGQLEPALVILRDIWSQGYACLDILGTMFRIMKKADFAEERLQLEMIKVRRHRLDLSYRSDFSLSLHPL